MQPIGVYLVRGLLVIGGLVIVVGAGAAGMSSMTRGSRRPMLAALALASLAALAGCNQHDVDTFLGFLVGFVFAPIATINSTIGIAVAATQIARRRRGSAINLGIAIPFAIFAAALIAVLVKNSSVARPTVLLLVLIGSPFPWVVVAAASLIVSPRPSEPLPPAPQPPGEAPPRPRPAPAVGNVVLIVAPLVMALAACGSIFARCVGRSAPRASDPGAVSTALDEEAPSPVGPPAKLVAGQVFELVWTASLGAWNNDVSFAPSGEVVAVSRAKLSLLDAATGRTLAEHASCSTVTGGFGWLDERRAALVCNDEVRLYDLPLLRATPTPLVQHRALELAGGAVHPNLIVATDNADIVSKKGHVRLFDPATGTRLAELSIPDGDVKGVAIAPDGVLFAFGVAGKIELREAPSGRVVGEVATGGDAPQALSFSADGKLLFADAGHFEASVFEVPSLRRLRSYRIGPWLSASRWLADGSVVATGSDGLAAFFPDGTQASTLEHVNFEGLAVSSDGPRVCAGDRGGTLRMFRIVPPPSR